MSKILIVPDVHGRQFWKEAVEQHEKDCEKIIFLGDLVDPYLDEGITRKQAMRTLEEVIEYKLNNREKVVLLVGNHCAHYFLKNFARSSRYDSSNAYKIRELYIQHKHLFQLAHEEIVNGKKYLFTHAGLLNSWVERNKRIIGEPTVESLNHLMDIQDGISALSEMSHYRTWIGEKSGSILWSDVRERIGSPKEIIPNEDSIVEGYDYQIFGHTQLNEKPLITDKWACLDVRRAFILNDEGVITELDGERAIPAKIGD